MRLFINPIFAALLTLVFSACATTPSIMRNPSSQGGMEGKRGENGESGETGRNGTTVVATGCEQTVVKLAMAIHDSSSAKKWADDNGTVSFICGPAPEISSDAIEYVHLVFDEKFKNLNESGYFNRSIDFPLRSGSKFSDLRPRAQFLVTLYQELEMNQKRDFGCKDGEVTTDGRPVGRFKICFNSEIRYVNPNGEIESYITMNAFAYDGSKVATHRTFEVRSSVYRLPRRCATGVPEYLADSTLSSQGTTIKQTVSSTCERFSSEYSSTYPSLSISY